MFIIVRVAYSLSYDRCLKYQFDFYYPAWVTSGRATGLLFLSNRTFRSKICSFMFRRVQLEHEHFLFDSKSDYLFSRFKRWERFLIFYLVALCPALAFGKMLME